MTDILNCAYCGKEFMGNKGQAKYCGDVCKGLAKVERDTGFRVAPKAECYGKCCADAMRNLYLRAKGWVFLTENELYVKRGKLIKYCPYCGKELKQW